MTTRPLRPSQAALTEKLRRAELAALHQELREMRAQIAGWISPDQHRQAVREAVQRAYQSGHQDGYRDGAFDALCPAAPNHAAVVADYQRRMAEP